MVRGDITYAHVYAYILTYIHMWKFVRSIERHCSAPQAQQMNFNSIKVQIVNSLIRQLLLNCDSLRLPYLLLIIYIYARCIYWPLSR